MQKDESSSDKKTGMSVGSSLIGIGMEQVKIITLLPIHLKQLTSLVKELTKPLLLIKTVNILLKKVWMASLFSEIV